MKHVIYGTVSALALLLAVHGGAMAGSSISIAAGTAENTVSENAATLSATIADENEIDAHAFQSASGAFNVGQNASTNSSVQQSMAIAASGPGVSADAVAAALGGSNVAHNVAVAALVTSSNEIEDHAFAFASGAFQVLQNASLNSGVSQSMAIAASTGFFDTAVAMSDLSSATTGNIVAASAVVSHNLITNNAFQNAHGAFNVLQNSSINSSVQQGMAISAAR